MRDGKGFIRAGQEVQLALFFQIQGTRAAPPKDGNLIAAFVRSAVTVEALRDIERRAFSVHVGDNVNLGHIHHRTEPAVFCIHFR